jgi:1-acyl-sn-glycerol-3-phosphate acyltransferase
VGHRLPNCFVHRESAYAAREIEAVGALVDDLGPREGVLIYPEGTRFTPAKRERVLKRLAMRKDRGMFEWARRYEQVLPPRLGGPLELLRRNQVADAVFCAHAGLEGLVSLREILYGDLVNRAVHVHFFGVAYEDIPGEAAEHAEWIFRQWKRVDEYVTEHVPETGVTDVRGGE